MTIYKIAEVSSTRIEREKYIPVSMQRTRTINASNTSIPPSITSIDFAMNMLKMSHVVAGFPNDSFISAMNVDRFKERTMDMNPVSETQAILDDDEIVCALRRADQQYKEGRARSLHNLIKDLGFEIDALRD